MIEIYPSPFQAILSPVLGTSALIPSTNIPDPTTWGSDNLPSGCTLFNDNRYLDTAASTTYSNISSVDFEVSVHDGTQYSSAFVYKSGHSRAWSPFYDNAYSVYGRGVTGVAANAFALWAPSAAAKFNYLTFGTDTTTKIKVGYKGGSITSVDIGPYSKNKKWSPLDSSSIEISGITTYDKLYITINNNTSSPLMVFADPLSVQLSSLPNPTLYIQPGIVNISAVGAYPPYSFFVTGSRFDMPAGFNLYISPGAYVVGTFGVRNSKDIQIKGGGVLDAYRPDDWWEKWSYLASVTDADKLAYSPFYGYSSFDESYNISLNASNISIEDVTIVNPISYAGTCKFKKVDNVKLISQYPNCDGFRINDLNSPNESKYSSMTRTFLQTGDDTFLPGEILGKSLVSGCYAVNLAATLFRSYFAYQTDFAGKNYEVSFVDIDCRSYAPPRYTSVSSPLYDNYVPSIFGLLMTNKKSGTTPNYYSKAVIKDILFSGIRIENAIDCPVFDIGVKSNPGDGDFSEVYGNISGIIFKDITVSTHPNSKYNFGLSNAIYASEPEFRPYDLSFINVKINDTYITNSNYESYFDWKEIPIAVENDPTIYNPSYNGSSIADVYFILGDSVAKGTSGFAAELTGTSYSSIANAVGVTSTYIPGAYIYRIGPAYYEGDTGYPKFKLIRPGANTNQIDYPGAPRDPFGDFSFESTLSYKLKQANPNRDIYMIRVASGGTIATSSTSGTYGNTAGDWSISSTGEMFDRFKVSATNAINILKSEYKHVNVKAAIICLGTNAPDYYGNSTSEAYYIERDLSSLVNGIRTVIASSTGANADAFYTKFVWIPPVSGFYTPPATDFLEKVRKQVSSISEVDYRFRHYYPEGGIYMADSAHFNTSGYVKMSDEIYAILAEQDQSITDPSLNVNSNYLFLFDYVPETGYATSKGVIVDYHWDRGQLHPFVATLHYIQEQAKIMQASSYYDDHLDEYSIDGWWKNNLQSYANSSTEFSGDFPNSFDNYTTYKFGKDFQKLYYEYTHNFERHKLIPSVKLLDGPSVFGHVFGSVLYNSKLNYNGQFTEAYPEYITSSLTNVKKLQAGTILFSTSATASGTYVASSSNDVILYTGDGSAIPELRNSGILSHVEFVYPSGTSEANYFSVIRIDKNNRNGYRYNPILNENTLIKQKSVNSRGRISFDISKYSSDPNLGYDVSKNFLTPNHDFKLSFKALISDTIGQVFGGESLAVWIHTKPEMGKVWTYTKNKIWEQHDVTSLVDDTNFVTTYCHLVELGETQAQEPRCASLKSIDDTIKESDVIASLKKTDFTEVELTFNTKNKLTDVPQKYFDNISNNVHRLNQNYVIEVFSNYNRSDKFTMMYDFNLVDLTLNRWSKPFVIGKPMTVPTCEMYCKEYRVDLSRDHLYNILKYFNEIAGAYSTFGYASRDQSYTSGVYESRGGSRINYVQTPEWNSNTKSSAGQFINTINLNN